MTTDTLEYLRGAMDTTDPIEAYILEQLDREVSTAWAKLLATEEGRLIAWTILDKCHVFSSTYTGNAASNFLEGERNVGLKILQEHVLPFGPHALADMMQEAEDRYTRLQMAALNRAKEDNDG